MLSNCFSHSTVDDGHERLRFMVVIIFALLIGSSLSNAFALDIKITNREGEPADGAKVQIFPGTITPDGDTEPIRPPAPRSDGLLGFETNADGYVHVDVPAGDYTIVAFSDRRDHRFVLTQQASAPEDVHLQATSAVPVEITALDTAGEPLVAANIWFRPTKRSRGLAGLIGNDGKLTAYVTPGVYHVILNSSFELHYLVLPSQRIGRPKSMVKFDAAEQPIATVIFDMPEGAFPAIYEVLETELTYEHTEAIEEAIGYDAAYTDVFALLFDDPVTFTKSPVTLTAGLTYHFNMSYVLALGNSGFYAYELWPEPRLLKEGTHHIGNENAEETPFHIEISPDKSEYYPEYTVKISYQIIDTRGNHLHRYFDYSGARLMFPFVTVRNPDGTVIASNPDTFDFFSFQFPLSNAARLGKYSVEVSLDGRLYDYISDTTTFTVALSPDTQKPQITEINVPEQSEAGVVISFSASIVDDTNIANIMLKLSHDDATDVIIESIPGENNKFNWQIPSKFAILGNLQWELSAADRAGNTATQTGTIHIQDTSPPTIEHLPYKAAEIGLPLRITAEIIDHVDVAEVSVSYQLNEGTLQTRTEFGNVPPLKRGLGGLKKNKSEIRKAEHYKFQVDIPATAMTPGTLKYFIQATDSAGNIAYFPPRSEEEKEAFIDVQVVDTMPPRIYHIPVTESNVIASEAKQSAIRIDAQVYDNNAISDVTLHYKRPQELSFTTAAMTGDGNSYTAVIEKEAITTAGLEYFLMATDMPDSGGKSRTTRNPRIFGNSATTYFIAVQGTTGPRLSRVELLPGGSQAAPIEITVGETQVFTCTAYDETGRPIPVTPLWNLTGGIGYIDQQGCFSAAVHIRGDGIGQIIAVLNHLNDKDEPQQATTYVKLKEGEPQRIALMPAFARLDAGEHQYFCASIMDAYDNEIPIAPDDLQWSVLNGIGNLGIWEFGNTEIQLHRISLGLFTASAVGRGVVEVSYLGFRTSSDVQVELGKIARIDIEPKGNTIEAGKTQQFTAIGFDALGNSTPIAPIWSVGNGIGSIQPDGTFTGGTVGTGEVVATLGNIHASVPMTVVPSELAAITTEPFIDYLPISTSTVTNARQFAAFGWDAARNPVPINNLRWQVDAAAGTIDDTGLFTATKNRGTPIGDVVINGTISACGTSRSGHEYSARSLVVIQLKPPKKPERLAVFMENFGSELPKITMSVGETKEFEITGIDINSQRMRAGRGAPQWMVLGDIGFINPDGIFTATRTGIGEIVVTDAGLTARVTIEVTPGTLKSIAIKPAVLTLDAGRLLRFSRNDIFTAFGFDAFENAVPLENIQWSSEFGIRTRKDSLAHVTAPEFGIKKTNPEFGIRITAKHPGAAKLIAEVGNIRGYAQLFVREGKLHTLQINRVTEGGRRKTEDGNPFSILPSPFSVFSGEHVKFIARGYDIAGNEVTVMPNWSVENGIGEIAFDGRLFATRAGKGIITARVGEITASASVEVTPGLLHHIAVYPNPLNIVSSTGNQQQFRAYGYDAAGNVINSGLLETDLSWSVIGNLGTIDDTGLFQIQKGTQGSGYIVAHAGQSVGMAYILVDREPTTHFTKLVIVPCALSEGEPIQHLNVRVGEQQQFFILGMTDDNRIMPVLPIWNVTDGIGYVDAAGNLIATAAGEGFVTATLGGISAECPIRIIPDEPPHAYIATSGTNQMEVRQSEFGIRSSEFGIKKTIQNSEFNSAIRNPQSEIYITWLLPDGTLQKGPAINYQLASNLKEQVTAIIQTERKTSLASVLLNTPRSDVTQIITMLDSISIKAGDAIRVLVAGVDEWGNSVPINPSYHIESGIGNLGTVSSNGLFIGNRAGNGIIVVDVRDILSEIPIEVIPNRPAVALLRPDAATFTAKAREPIQFQIFTYDARGNPTDIDATPRAKRVGEAAVQVHWKVVGDVGSIDANGIFTPAPLTKEDKHGEVVALVPSLNLLGRSSIELHGLSSLIKMIQVEPDNIDLVRGANYRFRAFAVDQLNRIVDISLRWQVFMDNNGQRGEEIPGGITPDGLFIIADAEIGAQFHVVASFELPSRTLQSGARVTMITGPLEALEVRNLSGNIPLKIGQTAILAASGRDAYGNDVEVRPAWQVLFFFASTAMRKKTHMIGDIGTIRPETGNPARAIFTATAGGVGTITATRNGIVGQTEIVVTDIPPIELEITISEVYKSAAPGSGVGRGPENPLKIASGETVIFIARNRNTEVLATSATEVLSPIWSIASKSSEIGVITSDGRFLAQQVGTGTIRASLEINSLAEFFIEVVEGELASIQVTPAVISVLAKDAQTKFTATGYDAYGNEISEFSPHWEVTGGIGGIDASGRFTPTDIPPGRWVQGTIVVFAGSLTGSASVTVVSEIGPLKVITVSANPSTVLAGKASVITLAGADSDGNPIAEIDAPVTFTLAPNYGRISTTPQTGQWLYQAPQKLPADRQITLTASAAIEDGPLNANVIMTLVPGSPAKLTLEPISASLKSGDTQVFHLSAVDAFGNPKPINPRWRLSKPLGELSNQQQDSVTYKATAAGEVELSAEAVGLRATSKLVIQPGTPVSLRIEPDVVVIVSGEQQEFNAIGIDAHNNAIDDLDVNWRIKGDTAVGDLEPILSKPASQRFLAAAVGDISLIATGVETPAYTQSLSAEARIEVIHGELSSLKIYLIAKLVENWEEGLLKGERLRNSELKKTNPKSDVKGQLQLISGGKYVLQAVGLDENANEFSPGKVNWNLSEDVGKLNAKKDEPTLAMLEATFVGEGRLIATSGVVSTEAKVIVAPISKTIGEQGGNLESPAHAKIVIPPGALKDKTTFSIALIPPPGTVEQRISNVFDFQPTGLILRKPLQLTISYANAMETPGKNVDESKLSLYFWDAFQEKWIRAGGKVDTNWKIVFSMVNHLAPYTIMESKTAPSIGQKLDISDIKLTPEVFYAPEINRLTIEYMLSIGSAGQADVTIKIYDFRDRLVTTLLEKAPRDADGNSEQWDGIDDNGSVVHNGRYVVVIIAESGGESIARKKLLIVFK